MQMLAVVPDPNISIRCSKLANLKLASLVSPSLDSVAGYVHVQIFT